MRRVRNRRTLRSARIGIELESSLPSRCQRRTSTISPASARHHHQRHRQRARRSDVFRPSPALLERTRHRSHDRHHLYMAEDGNASRDDAPAHRRLRPGAAQSSAERERLAQSRRSGSRVYTGQTAYGMAATGAGKTSDGARAILRAASATTRVRCGSASGAAPTRSRRR